MLRGFGDVAVSTVILLQFVAAGFYLILAHIDFDQDVTLANANHMAFFTTRLLEAAVQKENGHLLGMEAIDRVVRDSNLNVDVFLVDTASAAAWSPAGRQFEDLCVHNPNCPSLANYATQTGGTIQHALSMTSGAFTGVNYAGVDVVVGTHRSARLGTTVVFELYGITSRFARIAVAAALVVFAVFCADQLFFGLAAAVGMKNMFVTRVLYIFGALIGFIAMPVLVNAVADAHVNASVDARSSMAADTAKVLASFAQLTLPDRAAALDPKNIAIIMGALKNTSVDLRVQGIPIVTVDASNVIVPAVDATASSSSDPGMGGACFGIFVDGRLVAGTFLGTNPTASNPAWEVATTPNPGNSTAYSVDGASAISRFVALATAPVTDGVTLSYCFSEPPRMGIINVGYQVYWSVSCIVAVFAAVYFLVLGNPTKNEIQIEREMFPQSWPSAQSCVLVRERVVTVKVWRVGVGLTSIALVIAFIAGMASYYSAAASESQDSIAIARAAVDVPLRTYITISSWFQTALTASAVGSVTNVPSRINSVDLPAYTLVVAAAGARLKQDLSEWVASLGNAAGWTLGDSSTPSMPSTTSVLWSDIPKLTSTVSNPELQLNLSMFMYKESQSVLSFIITKNTSLLQDVTLSTQSAIQTVTASDDALVGSNMATLHAALVNERLRYAALALMNGFPYDDFLQSDTFVSTFSTQTTTNRDALSSVRSIFRRFQSFSIDHSAIFYIAQMGMIAVAVATVFAIQSVVQEVLYFGLRTHKGRIFRRLRGQPEKEEEKKAATDGEPHPELELAAKGTHGKNSTRKPSGWRNVVVVGLLFAALSCLAFIGVIVVMFEGTNLVSTQRAAFLSSVTTTQQAIDISFAVSRMNECMSLWSFYGFAGSYASTTAVNATLCTAMVFREFQQLRHVSASGLWQMRNGASLYSTMDGGLEVIDAAAAAQVDASRLLHANGPWSSTAFVDRLVLAANDEALRFTSVIAGLASLSAKAVNGTSVQSSSCKAVVGTAQVLLTYLRSWVMRAAINGSQTLLHEFDSALANANQHVEQVVSLCGGTTVTQPAATELQQNWVSYTYALRRTALAVHTAAVRAMLTQRSATALRAVCLQLKRFPMDTSSVQTSANTVPVDTVFWIGVFFTWALSIGAAGTVTITRKRAMELLNIAPGSIKMRQQQDQPLDFEHY